MYAAFMKKQRTIFIKKKLIFREYEEKILLFVLLLVQERNEGPPPVPVCVLLRASFAMKIIFSLLVQCEPFHMAGFIFAYRRNKAF